MVNIRTKINGNKRHDQRLSLALTQLLTATLIAVATALLVLLR